MRRDIGGFSRLLHPLTRRGRVACSRSSSLFAAPGGTRWALTEVVSSPHVEAGRRRDWSGSDETKGPVARNARRELDADARCQQPAAVGGESVRAKSQAVSQSGSSAPVQSVCPSLAGGRWR
jgi:hypothetical protein